MSLGWRVGLLVLPLLAAVSQPSSAQCRRVSLDPAPRWSNSAAWSGDGRDLAMVDPRGERILIYRDGRYLRSVSRPGQGDLDFDKPTHLTQEAGGYVLENPPGKVIWLDSQFRPVRSIDFLKVKGDRGRKIEGFGLKNAVGRGGDLVGMAILQEEGKPRKGFSRVTLQPLTFAEMIEEITPGSPEDMLYRVLGESLASAGGKVYALRHASPTFILQLSPARKPLKAFPVGFEVMPRLPEASGPSAGTMLFKLVERSTVAVKLYGRGEFLYLLTRRPAAPGTLWQLWQIDPRRDAVVRSMVLPTRTPHVVLAPGAKHWALLEKGSVKGPGEQEIRSVLLLPAEWIESPASKQLADGNATNCD